VYIGTQEQNVVFGSFMLAEPEAVCLHVRACADDALLHGFDTFLSSFFDTDASWKKDKLIRFSASKGHHDHVGPRVCFQPRDSRRSFYAFAAKLK